MKKHVGSDGFLKLEVPIGLTDVDCEVTVTVEPKMTREAWLAFIDETAGSLANDPIARGDQGEPDLRDLIP
jgi:hypothetical protein